MYPPQIYKINDHPLRPEYQTADLYVDIFSASVSAPVIILAVVGILSETSTAVFIIILFSVVIAIARLAVRAVITGGIVKKIAEVLSRKLNSKKGSTEESRKVYHPVPYKLLKITEYIFSEKTQKEVFKPIVADWEEEYFEALSKKEIWKARWVNVRYTYAFLCAMWQKSPLGDLIEFISKIAK